MTKNFEINTQRQAEHLRQLYLDEQQESKDKSPNNQSSHGGTHLPYGGGTLPKNVHTNKNSSKGSEGMFSHRKQRSWDMLDTGDDLRGAFFKIFEILIIHLF